MDITFTAFIIICPLVFLAGLIDSIAGGGGLISLPAYLLAGVPVHHAIATNKLSSCLGTTVSTIRYCKNKYADLTSAIPSVICALIGSSIGARLSLSVSERLLEYLLLLVLPVTAYFVLKKKDYASTSSRKLRRSLVIFLCCIISFIIGMYDGFYGPGTGTFLILLYTGICGMDMKTASGNTKLVNLSSNLAALITFLVNGQVIFVLGIVAALFGIAGNYVGSGLVMKKGAAAIKPVIVLVLVILFVKILSQVMV